ncbi:MAG: hypothetical protein Q6351_007730 [Candidatus Njordarchaeum guaymaensis]
MKFSKEDLLKMIDQIEKSGRMTELEAEFYRDLINEHSDKLLVFYLFLELYSLISGVFKAIDDLKIEIIKGGLVNE